MVRMFDELTAAEETATATEKAGTANVELRGFAGLDAARFDRVNARGLRVVDVAALEGALLPAVAQCAAHDAARARRLLAEARAAVAAARARNDSANAAGARMFALDAWRQAVEIVFAAAHRAAPADRREATAHELLERVLRCAARPAAAPHAGTVFLLSQTVLCVAARLRAARAPAPTGGASRQLAAGTAHAGRADGGAGAAGMAVQPLPVQRTLGVLRLCARAVADIRTPDSLQTRVNLYAAMYHLVRTIVGPWKTSTRAAPCKKQQQKQQQQQHKRDKEQEQEGRDDDDSNEDSKRRKGEGEEEASAAAAEAEAAARAAREAREAVAAAQREEQQRGLVRAVAAVLVDERAAFLDVLWRDAAEGADILRPVALALLQHVQTLLAAAGSATVLLDLAPAGVSERLVRSIGAHVHALLRAGTTGADTADAATQQCLYAAKMELLCATARSPAGAQHLCRVGVLADLATLLNLAAPAQTQQSQSQSQSQSQTQQQETQQEEEEARWGDVVRPLFRLLAGVLGALPGNRAAAQCVLDVVHRRLWEPLATALGAFAAVAAAADACDAAAAARGADPADPASTQALRARALDALTTAGAAAALVAALAPHDAVLRAGAGAGYGRVRARMLALLAQCGATGVLARPLVAGALPLACAAADRAQALARYARALSDGARASLFVDDSDCATADCQRRLAALARSTASCGGEGINDEQQEQQQENAPPHIETLVAFVVALLAQRRRCARLRSALRRQKAAALGMPGSSISAATMTLEEQRNAAVRPVAAELALAERCHALLCAALEHSLALLARHAGVTGRTDNDENEDNEEEEEEDALTPVAPRREAVAALLARHGPGGRVAAQMLADLVAAHDGTARHRHHHRASGGEMDDMSDDDDDDDISDDEDGGSGSLDVPASTIAQARAVLRCTAGTKKGTNTTSASSSSSSSSTAGAQGTLAPPSSLPPMPPRSPSPASMLLLPSKFSGSTLFP